MTPKVIQRSSGFSTRFQRGNLPWIQQFRPSSSSVENGGRGVGGEGRAHNPMDPEGRAQKQRALLLNLKISWICLAKLWTWLRSVTFSFFWSLPFGMKMSILCLSYHGILKVHTLYVFIGSQLERNSVSRWNYLVSHSYQILLIFI